LTAWDGSKKVRSRCTMLLSVGLRGAGIGGEISLVEATPAEKKAAKARLENSLTFLVNSLYINLILVIDLMLL